MKRKGYNPSENDVPIVLAIHNLANEQGWRQIKEWEILAGCSEPKLKRFIGRPKDLSPKAFFLNLIGYYFNICQKLFHRKFLHCIPFYFIYIFNMNIY